MIIRKAMYGCGLYFFIKNWRIIRQFYVSLQLLN